MKWSSQYVNECCTAVKCFRVEYYLIFESSTTFELRALSSLFSWSPKNSDFRPIIDSTPKWGKGYKIHLWLSSTFYNGIDGLIIGTFYYPEHLLI